MKTWPCRWFRYWSIDGFPEGVTYTVEGIGLHLEMVFVKWCTEMKAGGAIAKLEWLMSRERSILIDSEEEIISSDTRTIGSWISSVWLSGQNEAAIASRNESPAAAVFYFVGNFLSNVSMLSKWLTYATRFGKEVSMPYSRCGPPRAPYKGNDLGGRVLSWRSFEASSRRLFILLEFFISFENVWKHSFL